MTRASLGAVLALALSVSAAAAPNAPDVPNVPSWGIGDPIVYALSAYDFRPYNSEVTYQFDIQGGNYGIYRTNPTPQFFFEAPVHLPTGALVESFALRFCDSSNGFAIGMWFVENGTDGTFSQTATVLSTPAEEPGCVYRTFTLPAPITIDNGSKTYLLEVNMGANNPTIFMSQARIFYRLQVSPSPAVATFPVDVPTTHPFFRFIEALAASGVTAGCGPGMYCPNSPITRGEMAVFLAAALGMHFPN